VVQGRARHVHPGIGLCREQPVVVPYDQGVRELGSDRGTPALGYRLESAQDRYSVVVLQVDVERLATQVQVVVTQLIEQDLANRFEAEQRRVQLDDDVESQLLQQVPRDRLDLVGRAPVERRERHAVRDRLWGLEVGVRGEVVGQLAPQLFVQRSRVQEPLDESRDLVTSDSVEVIADADVEHRVQAAVGGEPAERAGRLEDLDQEGGLGVLAEGFLDSQLLRPFHVEADARRVDAGARNLETVVHLHGLQLDDPTSRQPGENYVLGELRMRAGCRPDGG